MADFHYPRAQFIQSLSKTVKLDQEDDRGAVIGVARVVRRLHRLAAEAVHHFQRTGDNTRPDNVAHRGRRRLNRIEDRKQHTHRFRRAHDAAGNAGYNAHRAFATDEHAGKIIPWRIRHTAGLDDAPVRQHHFEAKNMVHGDTAGEAVRPARICTDIATNGARLLACRVRRIVITMRHDRL